MKVVLCGPPHSGKSCLRAGLKDAIMPFHRAGHAPYPLVLTACPDGEGAWYSPTARRDPELAQKLKADYKSKFTLEFAIVKAKQVENTNEPLTIVDIGGKIDDKNRLIVASATHAVILAGDVNRVPEWVDFCHELNLKIIAILHSDYEGTSDRIDSEVPLLKGSIHHLERSEDVSTRPTVLALARLLVQLSRE